MRQSVIVKKMSFKVFSSTFTLVMQALFGTEAYSFYTIQVLSNLLTSAILNYGLVYSLKTNPL